MPPASRNHRAPTAGDTPAPAAASSLDRPAAIDAQNRRRSSLRATPAHPGDRNAPRPDRSERRFRVLIAIPSVQVLRRPLESTLAFAGVLDAKLADVARALAVPEPLVREACLLHRLSSTSPAYWQGWNRLRAQTGGKFHTLFDAVNRAMADTPRSSSLVENLNSRLRSYFTLRRHLGGSYLDLLGFFLNHRRFLRSRRAERQGKSPRELMTGQGHPHWLTLLGLGPLQPQRA